MMDVVQYRKFRCPGFTISRVYVDGAFFCHILEDEDRGLRQDMSEEQIRAIKVPGKTAIPVGEYMITREYSPRFGKIMPSIPNVKCFVGIRMHGGNTSKDTDGCPLFGEANEQNIRDWVSNSKKQFNLFDKRLKSAGGRAKLHIVWDYNE